MSGPTLRVSGSLGLKQAPRMCMSNKFLANVAAAGAETIYKYHKSMTAVLNFGFTLESPGAQ